MIRNSSSKYKSQPIYRTVINCINAFESIYEIRQLEKKPLFLLFLTLQPIITMIKKFDKIDRQFFILFENLEAKKLKLQFFFLLTNIFKYDSRAYTHENPNKYLTKINAVYQNMSASI